MKILGALDCLNKELQFSQLSPASNASLSQPNHSNDNNDSNNMKAIKSSTTEAEQLKVNDNDKEKKRTNNNNEEEDLNSKCRKIDLTEGTLGQNQNNSVMQDYKIVFTFIKIIFRLLY